MVLWRLHDDVVRGAHGPLQSDCLYDGHLRPSLVSRRDGRTLVSRMGLERRSLDFAALREVVAVKLCQEFQDADTHHLRRARLPRAIHSIFELLHGPTEDEYSFASYHLLERRPLA